MPKKPTLPVITPVKHKSFGKDLDFCIEKGYDQTRKLQGHYYDFYTGANSDFQTKRNWYISSFPGAGKTYTGIQMAKHLQMEPVRFSTNATMFGLAMRLVYEAYYSKEEVISIWIDDMDAFFTGDDNLNTMKSLMDTTEPHLSWNKGVPKQYLANKPELEEAIAHFEVPGVGFVIPTERFTRFRFLTTSNHTLTTTTDIRTGKVRKTRQADGESAIYSRVIVKSFDLPQDENWGWLASIVLTMPHFEAVSGKTFTISAADKYELLTWLHSHWDRLGDTSLRTVGEMASVMKLNPDGYLNDWKDKLV